MPDFIALAQSISAVISYSFKTDLIGFIPEVLFAIFFGLLVSFFISQTFKENSDLPNIWCHAVFAATFLLIVILYIISFQNTGNVVQEELVKHEDKETRIIFSEQNYPKRKDRCHVRSIDTSTNKQIGHVIFPTNFESCSYTDPSKQYTTRTVRVGSDPEDIWVVNLIEGTIKK